MNGGQCSNTKICIEESNMIFGPYPKKELFHIEKSDVYNKLSSQGIAVVEFLLLRWREKKDPVIFIVEAKSSAPSPNKEFNFKRYTESIQHKWVNSFFLFWTIYLGRNDSKDFPNTFRDLDAQKLDFRFLLVINEFKSEWLAPLRDALSPGLMAMCKTWKINPSNVIVYNDHMARTSRLIT
jgi:hypothetical protein